MTEDPCLGRTVGCPTPTIAGYKEGDGLRKIDRCAFPLTDADVWKNYGQLADQLVAMNSPASLAQVLANLNRSARDEGKMVPGSPGAQLLSFRWDSTDDNVDWWIPQGISGSADAHPSGNINGKELIVASWYYKQSLHSGSTGKKGVRISLADLSNSNDVRYRHLLLVEPKLNNGTPDFAAVNIHAGGIVWIGSKLYVADTSQGFRVFDMNRIFEVDTSKSVIGYSSQDGLHYAGLYRYAIPQIGRYSHSSACTPRFSFVALDRSISPPNLISGEYTSSNIYGRLFRWPLANDKLAAAVSFPSEAWYAGQSHLQGAVAHNGVWWLSSSEPPSNGGDLYRVTSKGSTTFPWNEWPEDLMYDTSRNQIWSLSEGDGARWVFSVDMKSYP